MTIPRKNMDLVNAPVLFRLPNLHTDHADRRDGSSTADRVPQRHAASGQRNSVASDVPAGSSTRSMIGDRLAAPRSEILAKRSVILLAMTFVACVAWFAGRHHSDRQIAEAAGPAEIAARTPSRDTVGAKTATAMNVAVKPEPDTAPANRPERQGGPRPQASPVGDTSDFYVSDDVGIATDESGNRTLSAADAASPNSSANPAARPGEESSSIAMRPAADESGDVHDIFKGLSFGALAPPANHAASQSAESGSELPDLPIHTDQATPDPQSPSADSELAASSQQATTAESPEVSAPAAENVPDGSGVPLSSAANPPSLDSNSTVTSEGQSPKLRRVPSRTPNDIPDWSRYFPGGNESVRAASAEGMIDQADGSSQSSNRQASYLGNDASF